MLVTTKMHHIKLRADGDSIGVTEATLAFTNGRVVGYSSGASIAMLFRLVVHADLFLNGGAAVALANR